MSNFITFIKCNFIQQTRNYRFFMIIGISIFLGFLCVPSLSAGYEIFYLGGVRGIYNSAWLGVMGAMLPVILLWLPGFYLLRSQIAEDSELKIGQMIASSPITKFSYIFGKFAANFSILIVLQLMFLIALIAMQFIQHESLTLSLMDYIQPLILITFPYLLVLAALTILFDVVPLLKGSFGNIIIFVLWLALSTVSVASPDNTFDLFGIGMLLNAMMEGARLYYPGLPDAASFGYYVTNEKITTFVWNGVTWNDEFLISRLAWFIISLLITLISVVVFNRFKESIHSKINSKKNISNNQVANKYRLEKLPDISTIKRNQSINLLQIVCGELKIMLRGHTVWWYLGAVIIMVLTPFVTSEESLKWISLSMLLPMSVWSQMGNRDKSCGTLEIVGASCSSILKWMATWLSGVIIAILMSSGIFIRVVLLSEWNYLVSWITGIVFIPTLALVLGSTSRNGRLFEAIFITLMYFGPINDMWKFDFMGLSSDNAALYAIITICLLGVGIITQLIKKRPFWAWR